jgi:acid phosphatase
MPSSMILIQVVSLLAATSSTYSFDPLQHLAGIAPYFEPSDPPLDPAPPQGCNVTRAAYLVRHA